MALKQSGKKSVRRQRSSDFEKQLANNNLSVVGQVIAWASKPDDNTMHTQQSLIAALLGANLSADLAPDLLPKSAFTRACRQMEDDRSIKVVDRNTPYITFQFTAEFLDNKGKEWKFKKEGMVVLNTDTGKITSDEPQLEKMAQAELDKHTILRTTADITRIVQKFFESQSDLIPFREQGGSYIVLAKDIHLVDQMERFLNQLKGRMQRLTIYTGGGNTTKADDRTVAECIAEYMAGTLRELKVEVEGLTINSRNDTVARQAERIKALKLKIRSVAHLMREHADDGLKNVDKLDQELLAKLSGYQTQRENAPEKTEGEKRDMVFGHNITSLIRWMRSQNWTKKDANLVLAEFGLTASKNTINTQYWRSEHWSGSKNEKEKRQGSIPKYKEDEVKQLLKLYKKVRAS